MEACGNQSAGAQAAATQDCKEEEDASLLTVRQREPRRDRSLSESSEQMSEVPEGIAPEFKMPGATKESASFATIDAQEYAIGAEGSVRCSHDSQAESRQPANIKKDILLLVPVGSKTGTRDLAKKNIEHFWRTIAPNTADVFLVHYDGGQEIWKADAQEWYASNVNCYASIRGFKYQIMRKLPVAFLQNYDWVWALDEDIDVSKTDLVRMFDLARRTDALIILPALAGRPVFKIQARNPSCSYRYTNFVDIIAPMFRTETIAPILWNCTHCIHDHSSWGLAHVWCNFAALHFYHPQERACAILDETPVIHQDFKSMGKKWAYMNKARRDKDDVKNHHDSEYVDGHCHHGKCDFVTYKCVAPRS